MFQEERLTTHHRVTQRRATQRRVIQRRVTQRRVTQFRDTHRRVTLYGCFFITDYHHWLIDVKWFRYIDDSPDWSKPALVASHPV